MTTTGAPADAAEKPEKPWHLRPWYQRHKGKVVAGGIVLGVVVAAAAIGLSGGLAAPVVAGVAVGIGVTVAGVSGTAALASVASVASLATIVGAINYDSKRKNKSKTENAVNNRKEKSSKNIKEIKKDAAERMKEINNDPSKNKKQIQDEIIKIKKSARLKIINEKKDTKDLIKQIRDKAAKAYYDEKYGKVNDQLAKMEFADFKQRYIEGKNNRRGVSIRKIEELDTKIKEFDQKIAIDPKNAHFSRVQRAQTIETRDYLKAGMAKAAKATASKKNDQYNQAFLIEFNNDYLDRHLQSTFSADLGSKLSKDIIENDMGPIVDFLLRNDALLEDVKKYKDGQGMKGFSTEFDEKLQTHLQGALSSKYLKKLIESQEKKVQFLQNIPVDLREAKKLAGVKNVSPDFLDQEKRLLARNANDLKKEKEKLEEMKKNPEAYLASYATQMMSNIEFANRVLDKVENKKWQKAETPTSLTNVKNETTVSLRERSASLPTMSTLEVKKADGRPRAASYGFEHFKAHSGRLQELSQTAKPTGSTPILKAAQEPDADKKKTERKSGL